MTLERISELSCPGSALTGDLVDEYFLIWRSGKRDMVGLMQVSVLFVAVSGQDDFSPEFLLFM